jgi:hypothetical protein
MRPTSQEVVTMPSDNFGDHAHNEVTKDTSLELLEREDRRILELFDEIVTKRGASVEDRADYGDEAKALVRHLATREAALLDVADGLAKVPGLEGLRERFLGDPTPRRRKMDTVEHMSRGIQGIYLNTGQDFDGELSALVVFLRSSLEWDLDEGIPEVRQRVGVQDTQLFHSAGHVARHAPTSLDPTGPRWWERAPVISRFVSVYQHLRDYPKATRGARN